MSRVWATISIAINPDTTAKANETFQVNLSNAVGATLATTSATGTIVDTVPPPTAAPATASFEETGDWGSGFGGQITITNNGSTAINNWAMMFNWDRSISAIWNGSVVSHNGSQYVITGTLDSFTREQATAALEELGAKVSDGVSKKTTAVFAGEAPGASKTRKAAAAGVPILSEADLKALLGL